MKNTLDAPRLKGKLELVVYQRAQPYEADVLALQQAGAR